MRAARIMIVKDAEAHLSATRKYQACSFLGEIESLNHVWQQPCAASLSSALP